MSRFDPQSYGPVVAALLDGAPLNELGPGEPNTRAYAALKALTPESLAASAVLHDRQMALACIAALWLRHDYADQSHGISQSLDMLEGSYWHGILHRREPDFGNARYWMRRVGTHAIYGPLLAGARQLTAEAKPASAAAFLLEQTVWDPGRFIDLCEDALDDSPPLHTLVKRIQGLEWELLFDHCFGLAVGT
jgi:hypothetical protein